MMVRILLLLAVLACPAAAADDGTIVGSWRLVEQTYGSGGTDLFEAQPPVHLELTRTPSGVAGKTWLEGHRANAVGWPAFFVDGRSTPIEVRRVEGPASGDRVRAVYEVRPPDEPGAVIEITEEYELAEDGKALVGDVTVRLLRDGKPGGEYVLRRRFERQR